LEEKRLPFFLRMVSMFLRSVVGFGEDSMNQGDRLKPISSMGEKSQRGAAIMGLCAIMDLRPECVQAIAERTAPVSVAAVLWRPQGYVPW
jgi:hypothetical protein